MHEDQRHGLDNPQETLVALAAKTTCPICGENPCSIIITASILLLQAHMVETRISASNYNEGLRLLQRSIRDHKSGAADRIWRVWKNRPPIWESGASKEQHLQTETRDPPATNGTYEAGKRE